MQPRLNGNGQDHRLPTHEEGDGCAYQVYMERQREGENGIKIYLREIGQIPRLTAADEVRLAARVKRGDKEARALMIKANLPLVVKVARDYSNFGLPLLDLISEGNIGLMKAAKQFDPKNGNQFSTHAAWWISQSIKEALPRNVQSTANSSLTTRDDLHAASMAGARL